VYVVRGDYDEVHTCHYIVMLCGRVITDLRTT
jgi:hypothetical protein